MSSVSLLQDNLSILNVLYYGYIGVTNMHVYYTMMCTNFEQIPIKIDEFFNLFKNLAKGYMVFCQKC